jgi:NAD(P)H dehydrogenase (quinone)
MSKILVGYYSRTGNTQKMAEIIAEAAKEEGADVTLMSVEDIKIAELPGFDAIVIGSPTYYGTLAYEVKKLIDESVKYHRKLDGKIGGAFASSANIGGGNETTILSILQAWLIHGMVVMGDPKGDHYGPVSIGKPDERATKGCVRYGQRVAKLANDLHK